MSTPGCISLHMGKAGVRLANLVWDFLCEEQGVMVDGTANHMKVLGDRQCPNFKFFDITSTGRHTPRAVIVDLEPTLVDELRESCFRNLFTAGQLISSTKGAEKNYAVGRYTAGKNAVDLVIERVRKQAEKCDSVQDINIFHSMGGGTGSGLTALVMEQLSQDYAKTGKMQYSIGTSSNFKKESSRETFNNVLHVAATADNSDVVVLFDNETLVARCRSGLGVDRPRNETLNQIVANVVSSTTVPMRTGEGKYGTRQLASELVPRPCLRFPVASFAPVTDKAYVDHESSANRWNDAWYARHSIDHITLACFKPQNAMVQVDVRVGKSMGLVMSYRGEIKDSRYIIDPVASAWADPSHRSVSWIKCANRYDNYANPPPTLAMTRVKGERAQTGMVPHKRALCVLNNNTAMANVWSRLLFKYEVLLSRKIFVHQYTTEGMEESEFEVAREHVDDLLAEYGAVDY